MAKFYLKFEHSILGEYPLDKKTVTIGRRPDNTIHIDHLSVSGRHARVEFENGVYVIYDHDSTNGTYVNGQPVAPRTILRDGDTIHIARHILSFVDEPPAKPAPKRVAGSQPEVFGDIARASTAAMPNKQPDATPTIKLSGEPATSDRTIAVKGPGARAARILVIDGKTDQKEYVLTGNLNVIGKAEMATIRLMRWFAPKVAANIHMRDGKFFLSAAEDQEPVLVNGEVQRGERELAEGDTFVVDGISMKFNYQP